MARKFLTSIDLNLSELQNAVVQNLASDPSTGNTDGRIYYNTTADELRVYANGSWEAVGSGDINSVVGTANEVEVSVVNGVATISLPATINADTTGNAATATTASGVDANSVALGTDTTGNYVQSITGDSNVTVTSGTGEGSTPSLSLAATISSDTSGNAATASALETARTISLSGDVTGSASFDGSANATITATIAADSVALGTDTTGNYVQSVTGTDGVSISGTGEGAAVTIANSDKGSSQNIFKTVSSDSGSVAAASNTDTVTIAGGTGISTSATGSTVTVANDGVVSLTGTANEIEVSGSTGAITVGLPDDVTIGNNLTVTGDLTVSGTTTTVNTETINLADNIITLNSNEAGTPSQNAGLEVERGTSTNVEFRWNEGTDVWEATTDGSTYSTVLLSGDAASSDISDFTEAAQDAVGAMLVDGTTIDFTYTDATPSLSAEVVLAGTSYLSSTGGLGVDISTVETKLVTDGFTKKASGNVGNAVNTSFTVNHALGTRDVVVNIYDNSTYDTVEADVVRTDANNVTVTFASAPSSNAYRVVVIG